MDFKKINKILGRDVIYKELKTKLIDFEETKKDLKVSRGFYIYGNPGCGKTFFVKQLLNDLKYKIIYYDSSNVRNKGVI